MSQNKNMKRLCDLVCSEVELEYRVKSSKRVKYISTVDDTFIINDKNLEYLSVYSNPGVFQLDERMANTDCKINTHLLALLNILISNRFFSTSSIWVFVHKFR
jgi:hypothetical protein